jgi:hypothetical protein
MHGQARLLTALLLQLGILELSRAKYGPEWSCPGCCWQTHEVLYFSTKTFWLRNCRVTKGLKTSDQTSQSDSLCMAVFVSEEEPTVEGWKNKAKNKRAANLRSLLLAGTLPQVLRQNQTKAYWLSGRRAWQAGSPAIAAPVGCTRTTASSKAQKLRIPVWFNVIGTAVA